MGKRMTTLAFLLRKHKGPGRLSSIIVFVCLRSRLSLLNLASYQQSATYAIISSDQIGRLESNTILIHSYSVYCSNFDQYQDQKNLRIFSRTACKIYYEVDVLMYIVMWNRSTNVSRRGATGPAQPSPWPDPKGPRQRARAYQN